MSGRVRQNGRKVEERWRQTCVDVASAGDEVWSHAWNFVDQRLSDPDGRHNDAFVQSQQDALDDALHRFLNAYNTPVRLQNALV